MRRRVPAFLLAVALLGTPSPTTATVDPAAAEAAAVAELTAVLDTALAATKAYGRQHLGHYLKLDAADLVAAGLPTPPRVVLAVHPGHTGFCLAAEHLDLPAEHPWRVAAVTSRLGRVAAGNGCGPTDPSALPGATTTAGGGLVCVLPVVDAGPSRGGRKSSVTSGAAAR